jgi:N-acetylglucosaminyldiphosphoundecaprenol N-acetyl-beta-D-mannosaminyltransferase
MEPVDDGNLIPRTNILGVGVSAINMGLALQQIEVWVTRAERQYVCVANVHTITESQRDQRLQSINNLAGMVTPDGMPLVWLSRMKGHPFVERVYGPDLLQAACERSLKTGWQHFFLGGASGVADRLAERFIMRYPGLKIAGTESPPFRGVTHDEDEALIAEINAAGPDILWVGLGAPKQEYWMAEHLGRVSVPVMIGVGAAFDFHTGTKRQAPYWMQRTGFEWLYRLVREPRRLWRRYLVYNPLFIYMVFLHLTGLKQFPLNQNNKNVIEPERK